MGTHHSTRVYVAGSANRGEIVAKIQAVSGESVDEAGCKRCSDVCPVVRVRLIGAMCWSGGSHPLLNLHCNSWYSFNNVYIDCCSLSQYPLLKTYTSDLTLAKPLTATVWLLLQGFLSVQALALWTACTPFCKRPPAALACFQYRNLAGQVEGSVISLTFVVFAGAKLRCHRWC